MVARRVGGKQAISSVFHPPRHLQGRAGAVRLRSGPVDVCCIVVYLPPRASRQQAAARWRTTVQGLLVWLRDLLHQLPARCTPVIMGDFNTELGLARATRDQPAQDGVHIGPHCNGVPNYAGEMLTRLLQEEDLTAVNTF